MIIPGNGKLSQTFVGLQEAMKPDYAIEVGAHAAEFSIEMANRFGIKAKAFEANLDVFNKYSESVNSALVDYVNYAISNNDGIVSFNIHHNPMAGDNSIKKRSNIAISRSYEIQAYKLDTYFKEYDFKNACLWIDVEGANKEVLTGAIETLKRCSSIFIETEDIGFWQDQWLTKDVQEFLESQGFEKVAHENVYSMQKNIIFIRKGKVI